jgi:hypothetical protein
LARILDSFDAQIVTEQAQVAIIFVVFMQAERGALYAVTNAKYAHPLAQVILSGKGGAGLMLAVGVVCAVCG